MNYSSQMRIAIFIIMNFLSLKISQRSRIRFSTSLKIANQIQKCHPHRYPVSNLLRNQT
jgi:hypothetical protein